MLVINPVSHPILAFWGHSVNNSIIGNSGCACGSSYLKANTRRLRSGILGSYVLCQPGEGPVYTGSMGRTRKWWETRWKVGVTFSKTTAVWRWRMSITSFGLLASKLHCEIGRIAFFFIVDIIQIRELRFIQMKIYMSMYIMSFLLKTLNFICIYI